MSEQFLRNEIEKCAMHILDVCDKNAKCYINKHVEYSKRIKAIKEKRNV